MVVALNKVDLSRPEIDLLIRFEQEGLPYAKVIATSGKGLDALRAKLWDVAAPESDEPTAILRDLVRTGETAVLVMPFDKEAPKGRIKQLQAQSIRELLDGDACCVAVKETGVARTLAKFKDSAEDGGDGRRGVRAGGESDAGFDPADGVFDFAVAAEG